MYGSSHRGRRLRVNLTSRCDIRLVYNKLPLVTAVGSTFHWRVGWLVPAFESTLSFQFVRLSKMYPCVDLLIERKKNAYFKYYQTPNRQLITKVCLKASSMKKITPSVCRIPMCFVMTKEHAWAHVYYILAHCVA